MEGVLGVVAGATAGSTLLDGVRAWVSCALGERFGRAQACRYEAYRRRFATLPPLVDGRPAISMPAWQEREWGSNYSDLTLTRERRSLGTRLERALKRRRADEEELPLASPETFLLHALLGWCHAIDRSDPPDALNRQLLDLDVLLSDAIDGVQRELGGGACGAVHALIEARSALTIFRREAGCKLPRMRIAQQRDRLGGEAQQALSAAATALFHAWNGQPQPCGPAESLIDQLERAAASTDPQPEPNAWLALTARVLLPLLQPDQPADWPRARDAASALGAQNARLVAHLDCLLARSRHLGRKAVDGDSVAGWVQRALLSLVELADHAQAIHTVCANEGHLGAPMVERARTAFSELRAVHTAAAEAQQALGGLLCHLDGAASAELGASSSSTVLSRLSSLLAPLRSAGDRSAWLANAEVARREFARALACLDCLCESSQRALHSLGLILHSCERGYAIDGAAPMGTVLLGARARDPLQLAPAPTAELGIASIGEGARDARQQAATDRLQQVTRKRSRPSDEEGSAEAGDSPEPARACEAEQSGRLPGESKRVRLSLPADHAACLAPGKSLPRLLSSVRSMLADGG
jgi:hypothetical protein